MRHNLAPRNEQSHQRTAWPDTGRAVDPAVTRTVTSTKSAASTGTERASSSRSTKAASMTSSQRERTQLAAKLRHEELERKSDAERGPNLLHDVVMVPDMPREAKRLHPRMPPNRHTASAVPSDEVQTFRLDESGLPLLKGAIGSEPTGNPLLATRLRSITLTLSRTRAVGRVISKPKFGINR